MSKDLRKEQLVLLRFEKQIAGLAAMVAAGAAVAKSVDGKLHASEATAAYAEVQSALVKLAEATSQAHETLGARAAESGAQLLQASGGVPKRSVSSAVASILGIG
ncbi:MAG: hypothetical protein AAFW81_03470 [Pseudomonadota bacterium]